MFVLFIKTRRSETGNWQAKATVLEIDVVKETGDQIIKDISSQNMSLLSVKCIANYFSSLSFTFDFVFGQNFATQKYSVFT